MGCSKGSVSDEVGWQQWMSGRTELRFRESKADEMCVFVVRFDLLIPFGIGKQDSCRFDGQEVAVLSWMESRRCVVVREKRETRNWACLFIGLSPGQKRRASRSQNRNPNRGLKSGSQQARSNDIESSALGKAASLRLLAPIVIMLFENVFFFPSAKRNAVLRLTPETGWSDEVASLIE